MKTLLLALLFCVVSTCAHADTAEAVLVSGVLSKVVDVTRVEANTVSVDGVYQTTFDGLKVLHGTYGEATVVTRVFGRPVDGETYYLVLVREGEGMQVVYHGWAQLGLCMSPKAASEHGIADAIAELRQRYPCKDKSH